MPTTTAASTKKSTTVRAENLALPLTRLGFRALGPQLSSRLVERLFLRAPRHTRPDWERALLATGERFEVPFGAGTIPAWRWGRGPTVLLVHGWAGRGSQLGKLIAPLLEAGFSVVAHDGPGHGDSASRRTSIIDLGFAVEQVAAFLKQQDGAPLAGVITHSVGGAATLWASRNGPLAERYVLIAPPMQPRGWMDEAGRQLGLDSATLDTVVRRIERRFALSMNDLDVRPIAAKVDRPLLVIHDEGDTDVPLAAGRAVAAAAPQGQFIATTGLGHRRILKTPEVLQQAVAFLASPHAVRGTDSPSGLDAELWHRGDRPLEP